jgi:hypothetical protein
MRQTALQILPETTPESQRNQKCERAHQHEQSQREPHTPVRNRIVEGAMAGRTGDKNSDYPKEGPGKESREPGRSSHQHRGKPAKLADRNPKQKDLRRAATGTARDRGRTRHTGRIAVYGRERGDDG